MTGAEEATKTEETKPEAKSSRSGDYDHLAPLFAELAVTAAGPARETLRDRLVTEHLPVAQHIARRFGHRGEPHEDLVQVATVGLINAVDRFDPDRGSDFLSFAVPTIMGEVRKYFRDSSWSVRMPRRLKELHLAINAGTSRLSQSLGRAPTPSELAEHLGLSREEIHEGLAAGNAYQSASLDDMLMSEDSSISLGSTIGEEDPEIAMIEQREALHPLLEKLPERERKIVVMRFFGNMTQTQIAQKVGISQMHVSRLLAKTLRQLRDVLEE
ncbi:RNA polymerase, sigma 28 subunit, SigD/FliA/WhiG [Lentzea waywayandensis]|uniref:RNA polymerase, sigma 28 subunit, SigD/FliA/WhiG n=2 Tax=Lentzea TaxID=165301 RepID=A0A1I6FF48_9PSEU|nr:MULTISPECIES: SigB/SigF/SigG family RNA polymerase sigma factor [Lentzea]MDX8146724.1 SigB/SigF/SigG family RNA polymerase sigma factor [Lentzea sp. BCCO 10_0061]SFR28579.1 RNA polymerase, sigma 28 subunit, SigD/FliA/WhiG [Lentzea waywayandensis]